MFCFRASLRKNYCNKTLAKPDNRAIELSFPSCMQDRREEPMRLSSKVIHALSLFFEKMSEKFKKCAFKVKLRFRIFRSKPPPLLHAHTHTNYSTNDYYFFRFHYFLFFIISYFLSKHLPPFWILLPWVIALIAHA